MAVQRNTAAIGHPEEMQSAAERVLESATFNRSPRLREFLSFVVKCCIENRLSEVNEYSLGVQVFGKSPNYNPNLDNIVRVTARQLRSKLNEYYSGEGSLDGWRVEIPKGTYVPTLQPNRPPELLPEPLPATERQWQMPLLILLAALSVAGWGLFGWLWSRSPRPQPKDAYLLTSVLSDPATPTTLVLDDPILARVWQIIGRVMPLSEVAAGRHLNPQYYETAEDKYLRNMVAEHPFVHLSSVQMLAHVFDIARSRGIDVIPVHCRTLQAEKMESGNFIFMGGVGSDPWVGEIQKQLAFEHRIDPKQGLRSFVNRSPRQGEAPVFESTPSSDVNGRYYTRVALLKNPFGTGRIVLLGGTSRDATEAAGQFAFSQTGVDQVQRLCGAPVEKLSSFELILETKSLAGTPVTRTVVASRCGAQ